MTIELTYRGIIKHKRWRPDGGFGTICPEWSHETGGQGFGGDPYAHEWPTTAAQRMLANSYLVGKKRYGAGRGIAFCAQQSGDGTWHGYPIPWCDVPEDAFNWLVENDYARRRDRKRQRLPPQPEIYWALSTDE